jgi:hypothetical protein
MQRRHQAPYFLKGCRHGEAKHDTQGAVLIHEIDTVDADRMKEADLPTRTILPIELQVARLLRLVKRVRIVPLPVPRRYGLLIEGRGFQRMLDAETLREASIHRPIPASMSQPRVFFSEEHARSCACSFGLAGLIT